MSLHTLGVIMSVKKFATCALTIASVVGGSLLLATPSSAADISVCKINSNYPHGSHHVSGTINAVGTISCDRAMDYIFLRTTLQKDNGSSWAGSVLDVYGRSSGQSVAATSCSQGPARFKSSTYVDIDFPAPLYPNRQSGWIESPWVSVACNGAIAVSPLRTDYALEQAALAEINKGAKAGSMTITFTATEADAGDSVRSLP